MKRWLILLFAAGALADDYPRFVLPLGGSWTDFELKMSTNNFATVCYWIKSTGATGVADDSDPDIYWCDDYAADGRAWVKSLLYTPISTQLANPLTEIEQVIVYPSRCCSVDPDVWMLPSREHLIAVYCRVGGTGAEKNASGTAVHWIPVVPVWLTERPVVP